MKKIALPALFLFSIAIFFCCKTYRPTVQPEEVVYNDEISDYLRSANVYMRNSNTVYGLDHVRTSGDTIYGKPSRKKAEKNKNRKVKDLVLLTEKTLNAADTSAAGELSLSKNEIRKATLHNLRDRLKKNTGDDDAATGMAIGLVILIILLSVLILIGLVYLLAVSSSNATNNSNSGSGTSGSNSNSGNSSGNGGGSSSGCYVATMVYGDYDAPQVMVLRKFRDEKLSRSGAGRAFIRWYYSWSPGFVKKYKHLSWLHRGIRFILDHFVRFLSR